MIGFGWGFGDWSFETWKSMWISGKRVGFCLGSGCGKVGLYIKRKGSCEFWAVMRCIWVKYKT
jgi:hypothetical protein